MANDTVGRKLSAEEAAKRSQQDFAFKINVEFGPAFYATEQMTIEEFRDKLQEEAAKRPRSFAGRMLSHFAEHINSKADDLAQSSGQEARTSFLRQRASLGVAAPYYGHGSCGDDECLCQDGTDFWCEPC